jgi:hypothetical protein
MCIGLRYWPRVPPPKKKGGRAITTTTTTTTNNNNNNNNKEGLLKGVAVITDFDLCQY